MVELTPDIFSPGDFGPIKSLALRDESTSISLHPVDYESVLRISAWRQNKDVSGFYVQEDVNIQYKIARPTYAMYEIRSFGTPVGVVEAMHLGRGRRAAVLGILIGEKEYWGQGIGVTAWSMLMLAVKNNDIRYVYARVDSENIRMRTLLDHFPHEETPYERDQIYRIALRQVDFSGLKIVAWTE